MDIEELISMKFFVCFYHNSAVKVLRFEIIVCDIEKVAPPAVSANVSEIWNIISRTILKSTEECHVKEDNKSINTCESEK